MINKERLEIIKMDNERHHQEVVFSSRVLSDIKWLIQQAERVEELELEVSDWRAEVQKWQKFYKESEESHLETKKLLKNIVNQNKRLREAIIEAIADIEEISPHEAKKTLREALNNGEN